MTDMASAIFVEISELSLDFEAIDRMFMRYW
jgi:hypothetical protein